jgi:hypothetical protein
LGARRCVIAYKFRTSKKPELLASAFMVAAEGTIGPGTYHMKHMHILKFTDDKSTADAS